MTLVSDQEKNEMTRLMNIMNGGSSLPSATRNNLPSKQQSVNEVYQNNVVNANLAVDKNDIKDMKNILTRFYNTVEDTTKMLVEDSEYSPEIKRALKTEKTKTGVKVGQWELIVKMTESFGKKAKNYTIKHTTTGSIIAKDLVLYEAANLLLKYLNNGLYINHPDVRKVLFLEGQFVKYYNDAIQYHNRIKNAMKERNKKSTEIFESRYDQAITEAKKAKKQLEIINSNII